jgi:hypothetical protein
MVRRLSTINVPMTIRDGMDLCPGAHRFEQQPETVLWFHAAEIRAVRTKFAKQRYIK